MRSPGGRTLLGRVGVRAYLLASKVHWTPRELAIRRGLAALQEGGHVGRIVDVGCGPGLLAAVAEEMNLAYLGLDADADCIEFCRRGAHCGNAVFTVSDALNGAGPLDEKDIVVLNGVAHHLEDSRLAEVLERARICGGLIVADHLMRTSGTRRIVAWMQRVDRGHFVRPYKRFEPLADLTLVHHDEFPIRIAGVALWVYFCNAYRPRRP